MKVLIDIAHPAHLHYFRNFARIFKDKGHEVLFTLRTKGIIISLARSYGLDYVVRSTVEKNKIIYALKSVFNILRVARNFRPDFFIDMGTVFSAPASKLLGKPHIVFEDTESASKARHLFMPLISVIMTPDIYMGDLGRKQIRFNSFMEMFYLHKNYYRKNRDIKTALGLKRGEKYVVVRFVSWEAHHDMGFSGLTTENKVRAVEEFSKFARVFISSESALPEELQPYSFELAPELIHDVLAGASLYFGEGATMAMESAVLGTPAIYINPNWLGYTLEAERRGLIYNFREDPASQGKAIEMGLKILRDPDSKAVFSSRSEELSENKIDPTAFLVWFVENWQESFRVMKSNPEFQNKFKIQ